MPTLVMHRIPNQVAGLLDPARRTWQDLLGEQRIAHWFLDVVVWVVVALGPCAEGVAVRPDVAVRAGCQIV